MRSKVEASKQKPNLIFCASVVDQVSSSIWLPKTGLIQRLKGKNIPPWKNTRHIKLFTLPHTFTTSRSQWKDLCALKTSHATGRRSRELNYNTFQKPKTIIEWCDGNIGKLFSSATVIPATSYKTESLLPWSLAECTGSEIEIWNKVSIVTVHPKVRLIISLYFQTLSLPRCSILILTIHRVVVAKDFPLCHAGMDCSVKCLLQVIFINIHLTRKVFSFELYPHLTLLKFHFPALPKAPHKSASIHFIHFIMIKGFFCSR